MLKTALSFACQNAVEKSFRLAIQKKICDFASTSTKSLGTPVFIGIPRGGGYFLSSTYPPPFLGQKVAAGVFLACSDVFYG